MRIFISYRRAEDNKSYIVGTIHDKLAEVFGKENVFRDTYDITAGSSWRERLEREVKSCTVMLVVMGPDWANLSYPNGEKRLFDPKDITRWEVETGLRRSREEDVIVIPTLVTGAQIPKAEELPESLCQLLEKQVITLRNFPDFDHDMERLISDIRKSPGYRPVENLEYFEPETIYIDEGPFLMGSAPGEGIQNFETPQREVNLPAYSIGKYPVTNAQFQEFVRETSMNASLLGWEETTAPNGKENYPVIRVTWKEALDYCQWLTERTKRKYSLPTEAQWEKACRGGNNYLYPWGNNFAPGLCNHGNSKIAAVDAYPAQSKYGFDFVGNVRQWTSTIWGDDPREPDSAYPYPWRDDGRDALNDSRGFRRVVRGGALQDPIDLLRCSARLSQDPGDRGVQGARCGFRVVMIVSANRR